jgi:superoxide dismutase, Cu-Zn family
MRGFIMAMMAVWALAAGPAPNFAADLGGKKIKIINSDGQEVGEATVTESSSGVLIRLQLQRNPAKIAPGVHAFHIHEVGDCAPPFKSAGAHWNPTKKKHGFLDKQGAHVGDLPNIHVPENSPLTVEMVLPQASLSGGKTSLIDADGFALVIHQGADDYRSDPAGDSGDRIACAAVEGSKK